MDKVSFIIPVYNSEKYLLKCIEEINKISSLDYEIILVNDGSKDRSGLLCDNLSLADARVRCIHQENRGVSSARNTGLKAATGNYICFLDSDDEIEPHKFKQMFEKVEKAGEAEMAIFGLSFDYYYNNRLYYRNELFPPLSGVIADNIWSGRIYALYTANALSPIWNKIFKREFLTKHNLYFREDMFLYEDLEYSIQCMKYCTKILFEPEIIYHYRQSEDEGNSGRRLARIEHLYSLLDKIENAFSEMVKIKKMGNQEEIKNILVSLYLLLAREKIAISDKNQILIICQDFADWYKKHEVNLTPENRKYAELLLQKNVRRLIIKRQYTKIRHKVAVLLKNSKLLHRLKD